MNRVIFIILVSLLSACDIKFERPDTSTTNQEQGSPIDQASNIPSSSGSLSSSSHFHFSKSKEDVFRQKISFIELLEDESINFVTVSCGDASICQSQIQSILLKLSQAGKTRNDLVISMPAGIKLEKYPKWLEVKNY